MNLNILKPIVYLFLLFLISCTQIKKKDIVSLNNDNYKDSLLNLSKIDTINTLCFSEFQQFFNQFIIDSTFQKNRVKYPLKYLISDFDYTLNKDTIGVTLIQKEKYRYLDFTVDKDAMNSNYDKYTVEIIKVNSTSVHYMQLGYDNGIKMTYKFNLLKGCWFLSEVLDEST